MIDSDVVHPLHYRTIAPESRSLVRDLEVKLVPTLRIA